MTPLDPDTLARLKLVRDRLRLELELNENALWAGFLQDVKPAHFEINKPYRMDELPDIFVTGDRRPKDETALLAQLQDLVWLASMAELDTGSEPVRRFVIPTDTPAPANGAQTGQDGRAFEGFLYNLLTKIMPFVLVLNWMEANTNFRDAPNDLVMLDANHGGTTFAITLGDLRELRRAFTSGLS